MASTYLSRTPSSTGNRKTWTISGWIKRCETSTSSLQIFSAGEYAVTDLVQIYTSSHKLYCGMYNSSGTEISSLITSRLFRDTNAFYHIVVAVDTTQATASNRVKIYINGVQETAFDTENYPTQNYDTAFNTTNQNTIGSVKGNTQYFDGIMSHVHLIDGTAYDASAFGEYDANGVWTIKTSPSVTYGNNGFFILKDGNSVTDQSGNSNNFTVGGGTLTKTEDSPSNVFATLNPLLDVNATPTFSNGNNTFVGTGSTNFAGSSIAVSSGKWYVEAKAATVNGSYPIIGVIDSQSTMRRDSTYFVGSDASATNPSGFAVFSNGDIYHNGDNNFSNLTTTYTSGDIIGMALDMDASPNTLGFYKNGALEVTINLDTAPSGAYMFASSVHASASSGKVEINFGNGYFGTTAVSSAGTNASGNGIFEYDVPTGYTALSTKGLNL